jgi:hypothetical protein
VSARKESILTCDNCGREVSDEGEISYGGHVHDGWYHLTRHGGSTALSELNRKRDWDLCGLKCLKAIQKELRP